MKYNIGSFKETFYLVEAAEIVETRVSKDAA